MVDTVLVSLESIATEIAQLILGSTYFRWALLLFIVAIIGSILSGLIDIAVVILRYGLVVLVIMGILEFVAPDLLAAILDAVPV
jgi:hypothetical protein